MLEFKELTTNKFGQYRDQLSDALGKADVAYIDISQDTLFDKGIKRIIQEAIKTRVENTLKYNGKYIITAVNGKVGAIYEINNGTPIEVPLGRLEFSPKPNINFASIDEEVNSRV